MHRRPKIELHATLYSAAPLRISGSVQVDARAFKLSDAYAHPYWKHTRQLAPNPDALKSPSGLKNARVNSLLQLSLSAAVPYGQRYGTF